MNKFTIELTSSQIVSLSAILTSTVIGNYDKLPLLKTDAAAISSSLGKAVLIEECANDTENNNNAIKEMIENRDIKKSYIPDEFYDTYNVYAEDKNDTFLIEEDENLRFIFGKQGQIGIEYWDYYDDGKKPDIIIFIKNSDAEDLLNALDEIIEDLDSPKKKPRKNIIRNINDKYQLVIAFNGYNIVMNLYKRKDENDFDTIHFHNYKQIKLFNEFLKYHLWR